MKKTLFIVLAALVAFASCQQPEFIYVPDNEDVSFLETSASVSLEGQDIVIPIARGVATEELALGINLDDPMGVYTLKTPVVTFAKDQYESEIVVSYDITALKPTVEYGFSVSFDEKNMSAVGASVYTVSAMMPLTYKDYGTVTIGYCYAGSLIENKTYTLQRAEFTTNYYKILGIYGSPNDLEFRVDGENFYPLTAPVKNKWYPSYPMIEVVSAAVHPSYGVMTGWIDPDPSYCTIEGAAGDGTLTVGCKVGFDIYWTVSAGYFGWKTENLVVSSVK